jgi:tetratricopeptide (TPR) repeat protein
VVSGPEARGPSVRDPEMLAQSAIDAALRAGRVAPLIARAESATGVAARRFATDLAGRAIALADPGSLAPELRARARALGIEEAVIAAAEDDAPPHAARVPLIDGASDEGFVRMLWVEHDPTGIAPDRPALDERARDAIASALARAADIAAPPREHDRFRLVAARPAALSGAVIDGESLGAAVLVSAVSLWSERPIRAGIAITGALSPSGVGRIGGTSAKVAAAIEASLAAIIVPADNAREARASSDGRIEIVPVRTIDELIERAVETTIVPIDPEGAVRAARAAFAEGWRGYRWPAIAERLARTSGALPDGRPELRIETLARLAAARRHLGDPEGSLAVIESARAIAESAPDAIPDAQWSLLEQQRAMTELRRFRFAEASRAAKRAIAIARRGRLRGELIKSLGCAGLVELARDRAERAALAFEEALALTLIHAPDNVARSRVYLIDALGRLGRKEDARAQWSLASREVERGDARARRAKDAWVRTGWGGALERMGDLDEAIAVLDVPAVHQSLHEEPLPGLLARRHLGRALALAGVASAGRGLHLLASSPLAHGRGLEPGLRSVAQVNVLIEAEARLAIDRLDEDARARARAALDALPTYGDAERWLGPARRRTEAALDAGGPRPRLATALRALIARCGAI